MRRLRRARPGCRSCALRYHNVYGPRMPRDTPYAGVASIFRSALAAGRAPRVFEDGAQRRDFVHVRDVARANVLALSAPEPSRRGAFNVASGTPRTVLELATELARACAAPPAAAPQVTGEWRAGRRAPRRRLAGARRRAARLRAPQEDFAAGMAEFARARCGIDMRVSSAEIARIRSHARPGTPARRRCR